MKHTEKPIDMHCLPTVFAVEDRYMIFIPFERETVVRVRVGERTFYDDACGVLRSGKRMHRVELPMSVLDAAGEYTVIWHNIIERKPYFPTNEPEQTLTVSFRPLPSEGEINIYQIADAHNLVTEPVAAARYFGDRLHLLVLNGDIPNHSGTIENFNAICEIAALVTGGEIPVVFARGNHDTRGIHAEDLPDYVPTGANGKTYFTFRLGRLWGLVLDCGEDKDDDHGEYGVTVCFHAFREAQTDFIRSVIDRAATEYAAEGVDYRVVISHIPFFRIAEPPFDIEQPLYGEWMRLMREHIHPTVQLHGHTHFVSLVRPGDEGDHQGLYGPAVIGSAPTFGERPTFIGAAVTLDGERSTVTFNSDKGEIIEQQQL